MKRRTWNLLSKHGQALVSISRRPDIRLVDLAEELGMTERSIRLVLAALKTSQALRVKRRGRNNRYEVDLDYALTHPLEDGISLRKFLALYGMIEAAEERGESGTAELADSLEKGAGLAPDGTEEGSGEAAPAVR
ncbi:hypothetical protein [Haloferula sargassicola]|uniref:Uncharacterized protein n=1 Tax=Haloferula sargassicola TaxID=490096 RepID=A0ABP9UN82_9BACT